MAILIDIKKYKIIGNTHFYHVKTPDRGGHEFYVGLLSNPKTISFYWDADLKKLIKSIHISDPNTILSVPELDPLVFQCVVMRCLRALRENHFPESMGWYS